MMGVIWVLRLLLVTAASLCPTIAVEMQVLPDLASDCSNSSDNNGESGDTLSAVNIDTALMNTRSNTTLLLENGCYHINSFTLLQDLSNISLIGSGSENTIVKCQGDVGLAFVNISGLLISNVTITNCRLSGENLQNAFAIVEQSLNVTYSFLDGTNVGILIGDSSDFQACSMIVRNTPGIGMVAINLMGESDMSNVSFINNGVCTLSSCSAGGGLYILYTDYRYCTPKEIPKLTISASLFLLNFNYEFRFIFGGGLSISLSQTIFSVDIRVASTTFENNLSLQGGGGFIVCYKGVSNNSVSISSSIFRKNGYGIGAGLDMNFNLDNPLLGDVLPDKILPNIIIVENTTIEENQADVFAGLSILSYSFHLTTETNQNHVIFKSCRFLKNRSLTGAAFGAQSAVFSGTNPGINITFDDVILRENYASSTEQESLRAGSTEKRSVAVLNSVNLIIRGKSQFIENVGTSLLLTRSVVTIDGEVNFTANVGSGIRLYDSSYIILQRNSVLSFIKNKAASKGGAIFVDLHSSFLDYSLLDDCFLQFEDIAEAQLNASLVFQDNKAPVGGTIYGSTLSTCLWAVYPNGTKPSSGVAFLQQLPSVTFEPSHFNYSVVSTDPFYLSTERVNIFAVPGKPVNISIKALDLFNQTVPAALTSTASSSQSSSSGQLGLSGYWYLFSDNHPVQAYFFGNPGTNISASIFATDSYPHASFNLMVILKNCMFGFYLNENKCECDTPNLPEYVSCIQEKFELEVPAHKWLGYSPTGGFTKTSCILDYCKVGTKNISDGDNIDSQCEPEYNRVGLLCASCKSNMSVVFGGNACRPCSSAYLASIIMYGVLGIVLVLVISFLGFSISEGYLNSLLFYCNVTSFYLSFFAPNWPIAFLLIKFLNLSLGFELCFYDGMDTLAKVGIQLLFPAYLFFIMLVIIILAKCSSKIINAGFSAAKTFSTLLLLCYTSVGETCILIVAVKTINGTNGTYYGWHNDPTIQYGQGFHGLLVFVAMVLILVYILPFSIGLLLPPLILRTRLSIMLKPLLDAFWNPFKPKFRFWIGLRALIRGIPLSFAVFVPFPTNCFLLIIFLVVILILHWCFQPFQEKLQNFLDDFFLLNLLLLTAGAVFFGLTTPNSPTHIAFVSVLLVLTYLVVLINFALHIDIRFPFIRNTAVKHYYGLKLKFKRQNCDKIKDDQDDKSIQSQATNITYSELREPFLDYGEGSYL